jgi:hypothetical protein
MTRPKHWSAWGKPKGADATTFVFHAGRHRHNAIWLGQCEAVFFETQDANKYLQQRRQLSMSPASNRA